MSRFLALVFGCSLLPFAATVASAQDDTALRMYGRGVHSFHAGQYEDALKSFDSADDAGLNDPRCFYFRGLTLLKLGKAAAAEADFKRGAVLESTDPALLPIVSGALQRVQGRVRVTIESHRAEARFNVVAARRSRKQALYGNRQADENDPISGQRPPPSGDDPQVFGPDATDTLVDDPPADSSDLFPDDPVAETATASAADDSGADDGGGLFGDDPPADDAAGDTPAPEDDDPFADDGPPSPTDDAPKDDDVPAADDAPKDKPADDEPADDEPADDDGDLFGDDTTDDDGDDDADDDADDDSSDDEDLFGDE